MAQREVFDSGGRLHPTRERPEHLATLSAEERENRGLRYPDEPAADTPTPSESFRKLLKDADRKSVEYRPPVNVALMLSILWVFADPVWCDFVSRSLLEGMNLGYNGGRGPKDNPPTTSVRNMFRGEEQKKVVVAALQKDIKRGNATAFSNSAPFSHYRIIPSGVVPKPKDPDLPWRFVRHHSEYDDENSLNALSAHIAMIWCTFASVICAFVAVVGGCAMSWDISNAFPTIPIRSPDHHLVLAYIKGHGFSARLAGDMGNKRCGFMWEIAGGRLLSTLYYILSFYTTVDEHGAVQIDLDGMPASLPGSIPIFPAPPRPDKGGYCDYSRELMLTDEAVAFFESPAMQQRLRRPNAPDLTVQSRWVDDFWAATADLWLGRRNDFSLLAWHTALGALLATDKFFPSGVKADFYGFVWNVLLGTVSFSQAKLDCLVQLLDQAIVSCSHLQSVQFWRRLLGTLRFFIRVAPSMAPFICSLARLLAKAEAAAKQIKQRRQRQASNTSSRRQAGPRSEQVKVSQIRVVAVHCKDEPDLSCRAYHDLITFRRWSRVQPKTVAAFTLLPDASVYDASAVAHLDWGGSASPEGVIGCVVASHGFFGSMQVPPQFYEPQSHQNITTAAPVGECIALLALLHSFLALFQNKAVLVCTDCKAFFEAFHKGSSKSFALDVRVREIYIKIAALGTRIHLILIPRSRNSPADALTKSLDPIVQQQQLAAVWQQFYELPLPSRRPLSLPTHQPWPTLPLN